MKSKTKSLLIILLCMVIGGTLLYNLAIYTQTHSPEIMESKFNQYREETNNSYGYGLQGNGETGKYIGFTGPNGEKYIWKDLDEYIKTHPFP